MSERLIPYALISPGLWTNLAGASGDIASLGEGIAAQDGDLGFIEQASGSASEFLCHLSNPEGIPDTSTGTASWAIRMYAKYVSGAPASFSVAVKQGTSVITVFEPTLASGYTFHLMVFDPAAITDVNDLRLSITSQPDGSNRARVTAVDLSIQIKDGSLTNSRQRGQVT